MLTFRTLIESFESFDSSVPFSEWFRGSKVVNPNGTPKIVYHGTDVPVNFKSFAPGSYFTDWKEEAESYSGVLSWVQNRKEKLKYTAGTAPEWNGKRVPSWGIWDDIEQPKNGQVYATDNAIVRKQVYGWELLTDLISDPNTFRWDDDTDEQSVVVRLGDNTKQVQAFLDDHHTYLDKRFSGGNRGRVYPVYLAIKRPLYLEPYRANKLGKRLGATKEEIANTIEDYIRQGYDGIITDGDFSTMFSAFDASIPTDTKHYIIFHSNQVRSAIPRQTE